MVAATTCLLLSHILSCFSDRLWDFAFPILLVRFHPEQALFVAALYTLSGQCATFFLATRLGLELDAARDRFSAVRTALVLQNGSTVMLSLSLVWLKGGTLLFLNVAVLSAVSSLASMAERITTTQEWAPVLMENKPQAERLMLNARLRQVYLVTKICAPFLVGVVIGLMTPFRALLFVCGWNVISCLAEMQILWGIWRGNAVLRVKRNPSNEMLADSATSRRAVEDYVHHPMFLCSLSYCLLFCSVLCPGSLLHIHLMTQYGMGEGALALFQGVSSGFGIVGTFVVTQVTARKVMVGAAARAFLLLQVATLWCACLALWMYGWSYLFIVLLALSRIGLWGFDVSHMQLMQDGLGECNNRATFNAIEYGLSDIFSVAISVPALIQITVLDFQVAMCVSLGCVTTSLGLYQWWWMGAQHSSKWNKCE